MWWRVGREYVVEGGEGICDGGWGGDRWGVGMWWGVMEGGKGICDGEV